MDVVELTCGRRTVVLHRLRDATSVHRPLLRLHALGGHTRLGEGAGGATTGAAGDEAWPGAVWGLDFTGHGASTRPVGGGYCPEVLMAEVDAALAVLGVSVLVGRGLGGYVGLLSAGARPELVEALVIADGAGLAGFDGPPSSVQVVEHPPPPLPVPLPPGVDPTTDPYAWAELHADIRPADYALGYLRRALAGDGERGVRVVSVVAPDTPAGWLRAVEAEAAVAGLDSLGTGPAATVAERVSAALAALPASP